MKKQQSKISSKNQVVIPALVRERLHLKKGSQVSIYAIDDSHAILTKHPIHGGYAESLRGVGKDIWRQLGGTDKYIKGERDSWGDR
jgi:AbrB family looped-hinge helix DNA binding protein